MQQQHNQRDRAGKARAQRIPCAADRAGAGRDGGKLMGRGVIVKKRDYIIECIIALLRGLPESKLMTVLAFVENM